MSVAPKLYLALGISGAPEHCEGMKGAQLIVAINTDPKAPIFDLAHYGANADCLEIIEFLKGAVEKKKTK
jgi:electron transfer flavoprotein alpha subunit